MLADGWATALLVLGSERGLPIAEKHGLGVLFIDRDPQEQDVAFTTVASSAFKKLQAK